MVHSESIEIGFVQNVNKLNFLARGCLVKTILAFCNASV